MTNQDIARFRLMQALAGFEADVGASEDFQDFGSDLNKLLQDFGSDLNKLLKTLNSFLDERLF